MEETELQRLEELFYAEHRYTTRTADFLNFLFEKVPDGLHRIFVQSIILGNQVFNFTKHNGAIKTKYDLTKLARAIDFYIDMDPIPSDCEVTVFSSPFEAKETTIFSYNVTSNIFDFSGEATQSHLVEDRVYDNDFAGFTFIDAPVYPMNFDREKALAGINLG